MAVCSCCGPDRRVLLTAVLLRVLATKVARHQWRKASKRHRISPSSLRTQLEILSCTIAIDSCYFLAHANCETIPRRRSSPGIATRGGRTASLARIGKHHHGSVPLAFVDAASSEAVQPLADHDCHRHSTPFSRRSAVTLTSSRVSSRADEHERKAHVLGHG
jgi:hypothetical protein